MRKLLKTILVGIAILVTAPLWIAHKIAFWFNENEDWYLASAQLLCLVPGKTGMFIRRGFYFMSLEDCAWDCYVDFGTWFSHPQVIVKPKVYIGSRCIIGRAEIGEGVLIGSNVDLLSGRRQHEFSDSERSIQDQGGEFRTVRVGAGSWIGNSTVVMDDVGANSIVGAGSVVVKAIPEDSIAVGNPAKVIRSR